MASTISTGARNETLAESRETVDFDWLLHSKKDLSSHTSNASRSKQSPQSVVPPEQAKQSQAVTTPKRAELDEEVAPDQTAPATINGQSRTIPASPRAPVETPTTPKSEPPRVSPATPQTPRQHGTPTSVNEEHKPLNKSHPAALKKEGRRSSWLSSLGSKFSSNSPSTPRSTSLDMQSNHKSPQPSPRVESSNPLEKRGGKKDSKKEEDKPIVVHPMPPRRPSVLVAAGSETKVDSPGFLTSALRRLSSSNTATLGKGAGSGAACPRKVMNIDHNRERTTIADFDQNKLRRVAFRVDVEIAGFASQHDEDQDTPAISPPRSGASGQLEKDSIKKESKNAKFKDRSEGAALKNAQAVADDKDATGKPMVETIAEAREQKAEQSTPAPGSATAVDVPSEPTTTRKKEKKKRSEAERKERKERKRRHAEANGLVPLELTREDDDSDSTPSSTPPGASTPKKTSDQPTTDPLRIYKRCCQLRETTALSIVKEQITKPAATLAEAPGTVAVMDISGSDLSLQDITTLGDWLAVVPVRKLVVDDCNLSDEAVRIILSGLSSCKTAEQARLNRKLPKRISGKSGLEQMGVIEKLSMKNNSAITNLGWKHIALFMHMSRSLRAIDLSGIPYPKSTGDLSRTNTTNSTNIQSSDSMSKRLDMGTLVAKAISERLGDRLEELILSSCGLSTNNIADIINCAMKRRIKRLGLANNDINADGISHVVRYLISGKCEGLDLGNNDLSGSGHLLTKVLDADNPLFALSLSDCNLTIADLTVTMQNFSKLKNFKFIDLSRNHALFSGEENAVPIFRKYLPRLIALKRIHLVDVDMKPDHVIALSEMFPDCPSLAHISILENESLVNTMNSKQGSAQEEACAFFVSLMTAVRASNSIVAIEIEVPSADSSEVVRALASQVVAYSLRNMERTTMNEFGARSDNGLDKNAPEVLLHLVGHMEGYSENHDNDDPAPDEDYMIASTGIVKALKVCLGNKDISRAHSRNITPTASGTATPKGHFRPQQKKPKDVSLELCESARKIRMRLRPALIKEDRAGNTEDYRRLAYLDQTLERTIQRFEDEYPETRPIPVNSNPAAGFSSTASSYLDSSPLSSQINFDEADSNLSRITSIDDTERSSNSYGLGLSRTSSNTSLAARALTHEEGRMHRFGQSMRRELLKPTGTDDALHGTSISDAPEAAHLAALRTRLEQYTGNDIKKEVELKGVDTVVRELGMSLLELKALKDEDPEGFEAFRDSQLAAQINAGRTEVNLDKENREPQSQPQPQMSAYAAATTM